MCACICIVCGCGCGCERRGLSQTEGQSQRRRQRQRKRPSERASDAWCHPHDASTRKAPSRARRRLGLLHAQPNNTGRLKALYGDSFSTIIHSDFHASVTIRVGSRGDQKTGHHEFKFCHGLEVTVTSHGHDRDNEVAITSPVGSHRARQVFGPCSQVEPAAGVMNVQYSF